MNISKSKLSLLLSLSFVATAAQARSWKEIKASKELRVCLVIWQGVGYKEPKDCKTDCKFSGPAVDFMNAFAKSNGLTTKIKEIDWDDQFANDEGKVEQDATYSARSLKDGSCDILPNAITKMPWREKKMDIITLYPSRKMVIVKKTNKPQFKKPEDLQGKTMAVPKESSFQGFMEDENKTTFKAKPVVIKVVAPNEDYKDVKEGKADFILDDADAAMFGTRKDHPDLAVAFAIGPRDENGWAISKDAKDFGKEVNKWLDAQRKDGNSEMNKLWTQFYGINMAQFVRLVTAIQK